MHQIAAQTGLESMHKPLVPMLFPSLAAHISDAEFQYPDRIWKEMCGQMVNNSLREELADEVVVAKFANTTKHGAMEGKTQTQDIPIKRCNYIKTNLAKIPHNLI